MKLLMVRHGEIPSNINKVYAGTSSEGLTEKGIGQAKEVAEKLNGYKVDALYSSPIQRALQTSDIICETIGLNYTVMEDFREMEFGPWQGLSEKVISENYEKEWKVWQTTPDELKLQGRETLEELQKRVVSGINKLYSLSNDKTVVVVSHVAIIRVLLLRYRGLDLGLYKTIHVPNAEIFEININMDL